MLDVCDHIPAYIKAIEPYKPGKPLSELERELGIQNAIKLASNENPLGPSPLALAKTKEVLPEIAFYPDGHAYALRQALARFYGISPNMVVPGNGSNDILDLLARLFLKADTEAIYSRYAFAIFRLVIQMTGALPVEVQDRHFSHSLQSMQQAINDRTRMIFIANPNNPTGTFLPLDELYDFWNKYHRTLLSSSMKPILSTCLICVSKVSNGCRSFPISSLPARSLKSMAWQDCALAMR